jgi:cytochrome c oxidase subunit II
VNSEELTATAVVGAESTELERVLMRLNLARYWCVSTLLVSALSSGVDVKTNDQAAQVIEMTARKYEFSLSQVHVKLGVKVQLKITALDRDHGFTIVRDPVGNDSSPHPGLVFISPVGSDGWKLNKRKETTIEFVARVPGTYEFNCSLVCGFHHGRMKGRLIVDP